MRGVWEAVARQIEEAIGRPFDVVDRRSIGGGCINETALLRGDQEAFFVKLNDESGMPMFEAERDGLRAMAESQAVRVPAPLTLGCAAGRAFLVLEWIDMGRSPSPSSERELGRQLARLHGVGGERFGWHRDNTIGSTPQRNPWSDDWVAFYGEHRLGYQFELANRRGMKFRKADTLMDSLDQFFDGVEFKPGLIHGDLWNGNVSYCREGGPVIYDPACYYADPEAEFGIIEMFGGFGPAFYEGYDAVRPRSDGFDRRLPLYVLYHQLNHCNLFGAGYAAGAEASIRRALAAL